MYVVLVWRKEDTAFPTAIGPLPGEAFDHAEKLRENNHKVQVCNLVGVQDVKELFGYLDVVRP